MGFKPKFVLLCSAFTKRVAGVVLRASWCRESVLENLFKTLYWYICSTIEPHKLHFGFMASKPLSYSGDDGIGDPSIDRLPATQMVHVIFGI